MPGVVNELDAVTAALNGGGCEIAIAQLMSKTLQDNGYGVVTTVLVTYHIVFQTTSIKCSG
jgi:hypothetical protein